MTPITSRDLPETYYFFKLSSRKRLEEIQQGKLHMKNLKYFIDLEAKTGIKGKGDILEASQLNIKKHELFINGNKVDIGPAPGILRNDYDVYRPVFCMMCKNIYNVCTRDEYPFFGFKVTFNPRVLEDFADGEKPYVLIIHNVQEFVERFEKAIDKLKLNYDRAFVKYRDKKIPLIQDGGILLDNAFTKDECFAYQEEFRFLLHTNVEDNIEINIGNIEDISVISDYKIIEDGMRLCMNVQE